MDQRHYVGLMGLVLVLSSTLKTDCYEINKGNEY
jgi:hypothetical protein